MIQENIKFGVPAVSLNLKNLEMNTRFQTLEMHFHRAVEIVQVSWGEIVCYIDEEEYKIGSGDILLINSGVMHRLVCTDFANITYIQVNLDKYAEQDSNFGGYLDKFIMHNTAEKFLLLHGDNELVRIFDYIKNEYEEKNFCYNEYIRAYIYTLVAFMRRNFLLSDSNALCDGRKLMELAPVVQYIDKHYNTKLSLEDLGEIIKSDRFRLCRLFKAATGSTLFEYINFVRTLAAEELLIKSQKNISEIAFDCGFASIQYFNRVFKENRGYTPGMYRKCFQNDKKQHKEKTI